MMSTTVRAPARPQQSPSAADGRWSPRTRLAQRRPAVIALCVVLAIVGGLVATWAATRGLDQRQVLVVSRDVARGQTVTAADLESMTISGEGAGGIDVEAAESVIGQTATVDLQDGALVLATSVDDALGVAEGTSVVGVGLTSSQLPTRQLRAMDAVRVINVPPAGSTGPELNEPAPMIRGTVDAVRTDEANGLAILDIIVNSTDASTVAIWSSAGTAAVVLDPIPTAKD